MPQLHEKLSSFQACSQFRTLTAKFQHLLWSLTGMLFLY
ncbi:hypothetical protein BVRB_5g110630 [Beta vulgaris subsp. vulgaris]|nr:hypothetical protein BVRB_5g110630 [Beta vulgaris subsp. vulgaris]